MTFTLKQLRYAVTLAETGHFGRAAERCHVTQPALSQQIAQLEDYCGSPLFDRLQRALTPTPFGRQFIERARLVLDGADALQALAAGQVEGPNRSIRFGLIPTVAPYLLPHIFPALGTHLPAVDFRISESRTDVLLDGLAKGNLDIALIATAPPPGGPRLTTMALLEDPFFLVTSASDTQPQPISVAGLPHERILLLDEGHCFRDQAIAACRIDTGSASRTFAATSLSTIVEFVANGQGMTLLPRIALRKEASDPRIAVHALASPGASRTLSLVWRHAAPFAHLYEKIAAIIADSAKAQALPGPADRSTAPTAAP